MTSMIDIVFLMLIFFMVTSNIVKQEADLNISLPTDRSGAASLELPSRHIIDILPNGVVLLNGGNTGDAPVAEELPNLNQMLQQLKAAADRIGKETVVTIQADALSPHYKSVAVLSACAAADIQYVSFGEL